MDDIKIIDIKDKNYPANLKKIPGAPKTIYFKGILPTSKPCFAVVGTRLCSAYGKQIALEIAGDLAEAGLTIVSGLAPGIDTCAHQAAIEIGGKTIAVLGTGIDEKSIYPKENIGLSRKILETRGCLISEYPPGTPGSKITFPERNRIISGLSSGVLVVEAKYKSGSLITANFAKKQGKKIFAVPGPIHSLNSQGTNALIKKGATLVDSAKDILKSLNLKYSTSDLKQTAGTTEEQSIINALREEPLFIEKIIEKTKLPAPTTARTLAIMEIKGIIRNLGGNIYALSR